jgi:hypothetical protein
MGRIGVPLSGIMGLGKAVYYPWGMEFVYYVCVGLYCRRDKDGISFAYSYLHLTEFPLLLLNCQTSLLVF